MDTSMPPNTAVPSDCRLPRPRRVASISGTTPRRKAIEVMRMGRRRTCAACTAASSTLSPALAELLGELDDEDGVLAGEADQHHQPHLAEDVVGASRAAACSPQRARGCASGTARMTIERQHRSSRTAPRAPGRRRRGPGAKMTDRLAARLAAAPGRCPSTRSACPGAARSAPPAPSPRAPRPELTRPARGWPLISAARKRL